MKIMILTGFSLVFIFVLYGVYVIHKGERKSYRMRENMTKIDPDKKKQVAQYILKRLTLKGIHLSHIEFQKLLYIINQQYYYVWREFLFDNFIAEQYGPVEKDIYDEIKQNNKNNVLF